MAWRQAPALESSSSNTTPSLSPCSPCICCYLPSNFHQQWKRHLLAPVTPEQQGDTEGSCSVRLCGALCAPEKANLPSPAAASGPAHIFPTRRNYLKPAEDRRKVRGLTLPQPWGGSAASRTWIMSSKTSRQGGKQITRTRTWRTVLHVQMEGQGSSWRRM